MKKGCFKALGLLALGALLGASAFAGSGSSVTVQATDDSDMSFSSVIGFHDHDQMTAISTDSEWRSIDGSLDEGYYLDAETIYGHSSYYTNTLTISGTVSLCLNGNTLKRYSSRTQPVITIANGGALYLYDCQGSGTISGNSRSSSNALISVSGTFVMYGGTLTENTGGTRQAAVYINSGGRFEMYDGSITGNTATGAAGVLCMGQFYMHGGSIYENDAGTGNGGGVYIMGSSAIFHIYGGAIEYNEASSGAGVYNGGSMSMHDGALISNNVAESIAGGVYNGGSFLMSGGEITGNSAGTHSGGVFVNNGESFEMRGGEIGKNEAPSGSAIQLSHNNEFTMTGGYLGGTIDETNPEATVRSSVSISAGYLGEDAAGCILAEWLPDERIMVDLRENYLYMQDGSYLEEYPVAVYLEGERDYRIDNIYSPCGDFGFYRVVIEGYQSLNNEFWNYFYNDSEGNEIEGLPGEPGKYSVVARFGTIIEYVGLEKVYYPGFDIWFEVEIADHEMGDWVVTTPPTATGEGVETSTCSVCGYQETRTIDPTGEEEPDTGTTSEPGTSSEPETGTSSEPETGTSSEPATGTTSDEETITSEEGIDEPSVVTPEGDDEGNGGSALIGIAIAAVVIVVLGGAIWAIVHFAKKGKAGGANVGD